jgi:hypothetical protein
MDPWLRINTNSSGVETVTLGFKPKGHKNETMDDTSTPNYQSLIARGYVVNHACSYTYSERIWEDGHFKHVYPNSQLATEQSGPGVCATRNLVDSSDFTVTRMYPTSKCLAEMDTTPYEMMEDVFEIREVLRFLQNPLKTLNRLATAFSRKRRKLQKRYRLSRAKALESAWLEYRFAILPLYGSISNIVDSFYAEQKYPKRRTSRSYYRDSVSDSVTSEPSRYGYISHSFAELWFKSQCGLCYVVTNPLNDWRSTYGLRAKDLPKTLWAIVPLSFMIDRLFNISEMLSAMTNYFDPNLEVIYGWKSHKELMQHSARITEKVSVSRNKYYGENSGGGEIRNDFHYLRLSWDPYVLETVPYIDLSGLVTSVTKTIDLIAIISQKLR